MFIEVPQERTPKTSDVARFRSFAPSRWMEFSLHEPPARLQGSHRRALGLGAQDGRSEGGIGGISHPWVLIYGVLNMIYMVFQYVSMVFLSWVLVWCLNEFFSDCDMFQWC